MKFNLKDWKKIKTEAQHTTLRNKEGHELRVLHTHLSKSLQKQLVELPHFDDGGSVVGSEITGGYKNATSNVGSSSGSSSAGSDSHVGEGGSNTSQEASSGVDKTNEQYKATHGGKSSPYYHPMYDGGQVKYYDNGSPGQVPQVSNIAPVSPVNVNYNGQPAQQTPPGQPAPGSPFAQAVMSGNTQSAFGSAVTSGVNALGSALGITPQQPNQQQGQAPQPQQPQDLRSTIKNDVGKGLQAGVNAAGKGIGSLLGLNKGGEVKYYDDGSPGQTSDQAPTDDSQSQSAAPVPQQSPVVVNVNGGQPPQSMAHDIAQALGATLHHKIGSVVGAAQAIGNQVAPVVQDAAKGFQEGLAPGGNATTSDAPQAAPQPAPVDPSLAAAQQNLTQAQQPTPTTQSGMPAAPDPNNGLNADNPNFKADQIANPNDAYTKYIQGTQLEANVAKQLSQLNGKPLDQQSDALQKYFTAPGGYLDSAAQGQKGWQSVYDHYAAAPLDFEKYLGKGDTMAQVGTFAGLFLGGLLSRATGGNIVKDFLDRKVNADIEQQKAELGKRSTMLSAYMQHYGNLNDAMTATKVAETAITNAKLQQTANSVGSDAAKANMLKLQADREKDIFPLQQQLAVRQALMNVYGNQGNNTPGQSPTAATERALPYLRAAGATDQAKTIEEHMIPGIGNSSVALTPEVRTDVVNKTNVINAADKLSNFMQTNSLGGKLNPAKRAQGEALAREFQQLYKKGIGAPGNEEEQKIMDQIIGPNPSSLLSDVTYAPKIKAVRDSLNQALDTVKSQNGLPTSQSQQQSPPQFKTSGGITYRRGPNGEAIRVK